MKNFEQLNLVNIEVAELGKIEGGVVIGGCIPPSRPFPKLPFPCPFPFPLPSLPPIIW